MSDRLTFVDTNVFVYGLYRDAGNHRAARSFLNAGEADQCLCISSQIVSEFYSTVTSRRRVTTPLEPGRAADEVAAILAIPGLIVLPIAGPAVELLVDLSRRCQVRGKDIFDLQIVATMLSSGVHRIATFNADDFEPFSELEVVTP